MAILNGYTTLAVVRARLGIPEADTADDAVIEAVIEAASREIDDYCGRRFWTTAENETRYYTAKGNLSLLCPDDIISVSALATDPDGNRTYPYEWAATDYDLLPLNAALDSQPYTEIAITPNGNYGFPVGVQKGVKVVGKFGYGATAPKAVSEACIIQSTRLFRRKDAPFGVTGASDMGQASVIARLDPDVRFLLAPYRRITVG